jgi:hypothetical protein
MRMCPKLFQQFRNLYCLRFRLQLNSKLHFMHLLRLLQNLEFESVRLQGELLQQFWKLQPLRDKLELFSKLLILQLLHLRPGMDHFEHLPVPG